MDFNRVAAVLSIVAACALGACGKASNSTTRLTGGTISMGNLSITDNGGSIAVGAQYLATQYPPGMYVIGFDSGTGDYLQVNVTGATGAGTFPLLSAPSTTGQAGFLYSPAGIACKASSGSAMITTYGAPRAVVIGDASVSAWTSVTGTCPGALNGSFNANRLPDSSIGNDGNATDTMSITGTGGSPPTAGSITKTEGAILYDPVIALGYESFSNQTVILFDTGADLGIATWDTQFRMTFTGPPGMGTFNLTSFEEDDNFSPVQCAFSNMGSVTITSSTNSVGSLIAGTLTLSGLTPANTACPTAYTGNFSITREPDNAL